MDSLQLENGDLVKCINNWDLIDITVGGVYKIVKHTELSLPYIIDDDGDENWAEGFSSVNFEIVGQSNNTTSINQSSIDFLKRVEAIQNERAEEYEQDGKERSVEQLVTAFNAITRHKLTEQDGWLFLMLLKAVRAWNTESYHDDSAVDLVSYASLVAESLNRKQ